MAQQEKGGIISTVKSIISSFVVKTEMATLKALMPAILALSFAIIGILFLGFSLEGYLELYASKYVSFLIVAIIYFIIALTFKWRWYK